MRACHHVSPTAIRDAPLDHWLALKAFYTELAVAFLKHTFKMHVPPTSS